MSALVHIVKCSCGDSGCSVYGLNDGSFPQGAGWDKDTAERHAVAINAYAKLTERVTAAFKAMGRAGANANVRHSLRSEWAACRALLRDLKELP